MTVVVGADEAGKGPVLGPMVAAAVRADPAVLPPVDDSKRLSADRREVIADEIRALATAGDLTWAIAVVPTDAIDDPETDMNRLTVAAQVAALRPAAGDAPVIVDAGDTDADRFGRRVREGLTDGAFTDDRISVETGGDTTPSRDSADEHGQRWYGHQSHEDAHTTHGDESREDAHTTHGDESHEDAHTTHGDESHEEVRAPHGDEQATHGDVHAAHGADEAHAIVGAASVLAKTVRDRRMDSVDDRYDRAVGSGYPSDETTRTFLREYVRAHGELPACARTSWATARDAMATAEQSRLDGF